MKTSQNKKVNADVVLLNVVLSLITYPTIIVIYSFFNFCRNRFVDDCQWSSRSEFLLA